MDQRIFSQLPICYYETVVSVVLAKSDTTLLTLQSNGYKVVSETIHIS